MPASDGQEPGLDQAFGLLASAIESLVAVGVVPAERLTDGWLIAWSAVHGFATLSLSGPLAGLRPADARDAENAVLDGVLRGLGPLPANGS